MEISSTAAARHQLCTEKLTAAAGATSSPMEVAAMSEARQQSPAAATETAERKPRPNPDKAIECARCNSTKTKFCYYNNYSMAQPRYFCKQCRRYWTQGGSLRNVPVGGGCRKNRRSSSSASVPPPAAASKVNKLAPERMVALPSLADFPNVLPTFSSPGFELPRDHLSLAAAVASAATLPAGGTTFLDILTGGLLDGNHQGDGHYEPPTGSSGMVTPLPPTFGVGAGLDLMMQHHGLATHEGVLDGSMDAGEEGGGGGGAAVKAMMGLQWPSQGRQLQAGAEQQEAGTVNSNSVVMTMGSSSSSSNGCYWNNGGVGTASSANPWQGLINSSFPI